jgi:hypothetical protein
LINRRLVLVLAVVGIIAAATPLLAHHSWPVDSRKLVTVKGTVTSYSWTNPHVMMGLNVQNDKGAVEKWDVGGPATNRMAANGWTATTLKPGDAITAIGYRFTDGEPILRLEKIVMADGKEMFLYGRR